MALTSKVTDTALVFEGGGMRASYTSGLLVALLEADIHLPWVGGISAGSSNTCNYVSRDPWRARHSFTDFAADPRFGDWRTFLRGQGLFNAQYIYEETGLPGAALPFDWETWSANPATVRIGGFNATRGEPVYWGREDLPSLTELMIRIRASSTMPVVMPPVTIDGEVYVDGALGPSGGIPLDAAQADGYEKFLVVLTRERGYVKTPSRGDWYVRRHFRTLPSVAEALRQRPAHYNAMREQVLELERAGRAYVFAPDHMPVSNSTRDVARLRASHQAGLAQARRELPAIREFLGL
ncbi:patatin-like phospholipase family protein [Ornithinimicrobium humiphilum]|uniref:Putative patatin/cPLA2 family phospholipase n=1 Tax=Ornithinimicrobium humiphilum TaxID=125288 RepID=A0A543KK45_9MICO|nr:patatin family protein [Ornithinimicrobium humiphilum]TQM95426.1 putative patatin/cPLA2 family phospholipase [Ornithinimicrobium humiphilum]